MELEFLHVLQNMHNEILDNIMMCITTLGNGGFLWIFIGVMLIILPRVKGTPEQVKKRRMLGVVVLLSLIVTAVFGNLIIKNIVKRLRPFQVDTSVVPLICPGEYSFPSGHAGSSFTAATILFLNNRKWGTLAYIMAGLIAFSRMYFFVHYPTDILGGIVLGVSCAILVWHGQKAYLKRQ